MKEMTDLVKLAMFQIRQVTADYLSVVLIAELWHVSMMSALRLPVPGAPPDSTAPRSSQALLCADLGL